jgi:DNA-binding transcriptional MerR regulator
MVLDNAREAPWIATTTSVQVSAEPGNARTRHWGLDLELTPTLTVSVVMSVSELAARSGITADTVRYYGRLGLLAETGRTRAGHRYYDESALERVRFIKGAQWFELSLEDIRELLEVFDDGACPCGHTRAVVLRRIAAIDEQRARLDEMRAALCRLAGADPASTVATNGHANEGSLPMTETLSAPTETTAEAGCGCCRPPEPPSLEAEVAELQARKEAVERRLAGLRGLGR